MSKFRLPQSDVNEVMSCNSPATWDSSYDYLIAMFNRIAIHWTEYDEESGEIWYYTAINARFLRLEDPLLCGTVLIRADNQKARDTLSSRDPAAMLDAMLQSLNTTVADFTERMAAFSLNQVKELLLRYSEEADDLAMRRAMQPTTPGTLH